MLSDIHNDFERFAPDALPEADLCLVAGDLTNYGVRGDGRLPAAELQRLFGMSAAALKLPGWQTDEIRRAEAWLRRLAARFPVAWIPGNHDIGVDAETFGTIPNCICLLNRMWTFRGLSLYGVSMSPCYDMPALATQWDYMTADLETERAAYVFAPVEIVVSHCPPYGSVDSSGYVLGVGELHLGSRALRDYILRHAPRLVLCGHIHEAQGSARLQTTDIFNVACTWQLLELA